jgi:hypothetical protein
MGGQEMCVLVKNNQFWSLHPFFHWLLPLCLLAVMTACGGGQLTQQEMHRAYQQALAQTETTARSDWQAHPDALAAAVEMPKRYFQEMTRTSVERLTKLTYAQNAFLCDTLHIALGADEIEAYFLKTADRVNALSVTFLDFSAAGREVFARWTMSMRVDGLAGGRPVTSYGISHFRFDQEGRILLHQDFWDAGGAFFEQLPGLKWVIPRVRGGL